MKLSLNLSHTASSMLGLSTSSKSSQSKPVIKQYSNIMVAYGTDNGVELSICGGNLNRCRLLSVSIMSKTFPNHDMSMWQTFVLSFTYLLQCSSPCLWLIVRMEFATGFRVSLYKQCIELSLKVAITYPLDRLFRIVSLLVANDDMP